MIYVLLGWLLSGPAGIGVSALACCVGRRVSRRRRLHLSRAYVDSVFAQMVLHEDQEER